MEVWPWARRKHRFHISSVEKQQQSTPRSGPHETLCLARCDLPFCYESVSDRSLEGGAAPRRGWRTLRPPLHKHSLFGLPVPSAPSGPLRLGGGLIPAVGAPRPPCQLAHMRIAMTRPQGDLHPRLPGRDNGGINEEKRRLVTGMTAPLVITRHERCCLVTLSPCIASLLWNPEKAPAGKGCDSDSGYTLPPPRRPTHSTIPRHARLREGPCG